jgi:NADH:ubiquinone oxidoreductase subunit 5 (subunit L)/multisubunit Na+/H+ antiporter MnhA subunit
MTNPISPPQPEEVKWYWWIATTVLAMLGSVFGAGMFAQRFRTRIEKLEKDNESYRKIFEQHLKLISDLSKEIDARLYMTGGGLIYLQRGEFDKAQTECQKNIQMWLSSIDKRLEGLNNRIDKKISP